MCRYIFYKDTTRPPSYPSSRPHGHRRGPPRGPGRGLCGCAHGRACARKRPPQETCHQQTCTKTPSNTYEKTEKKNI